jgi:hypothetical protein
VYGTSTAYSSLSLAQDVAPGTTPATIHVTLVGLEGATTFHYKLVCASLAGTQSSTDATFTTSGPGASKAVVASSTAIVSKRGVAAVPIACFGQTACSGKLTLSLKGSTIASSKYRLGGNKAGSVSERLPNAPFGKLTRQGTLKVTATITNGKAKSKRTVTLVK